MFRKGYLVISELASPKKYKWDGTCLTSYSGRKILEFDGQYVMNFAGKKRYRYDHKSISIFAGPQVLRIEGDGCLPEAMVIMLSENLF